MRLQECVVTLHAQVNTVSFLRVVAFSFRIHYPMRIRPMTLQTVNSANPVEATAWQINPLLDPSGFHAMSDVNLKHRVKNTPQNGVA